MSGIGVAAIIVVSSAAFFLGRVLGRRDTRHQVAISVEPIRCPKCGENMVGHDELNAAVEGLKNRGVITEEQARQARVWIAKAG